MIRTLITVLTLALGSVSFAAQDCNTDLVLSCQASYQKDGQTVEVKTGADTFANENTYEPSLANCASTVYIQNGRSTVRVYVSKDLSSNTVSASAGAVQIEDRLEDGQMVRYSTGSTATSANSIVGSDLDLGTLHLEKPLQKGRAVMTDIAVKCVVK